MPKTSLSNKIYKKILEFFKIFKELLITLFLIILTVMFRIFNLTLL